MTQNKNSLPRGGFAPLITRREALALGLGSAAAGILPFGQSSAAPATVTSRGRGTRTAGLAVLDRFIAGYCEAMNAPGLTLGLADRTGPIRVSAYGYSQLETRVPVSISDLFEIGSISSPLSRSRCCSCTTRASSICGRPSGTTCHGSRWKATTARYSCITC
jgi:hypothetical protein